MATIDPRRKLLLCLGALLGTTGTRTTDISQFNTAIGVLLVASDNCLKGIVFMDDHQNTLPETETLALTASLETGTSVIKDYQANASTYTGLAADINTFVTNYLS